MDGSIYLDGGRPTPAIQSIDRRRAPINERVDPYPAGDGIGRRWPERRWKEKGKGKRGKKKERNEKPPGARWRVEGERVVWGLFGYLCTE